MQRSVFQSVTWLSGVGLGRGAEECISEFYLVMWCRFWAGCRGVYFRVFTWCRSRAGCRGVYFRAFICLSGLDLGRGAEECISEFLPGYLV